MGARKGVGNDPVKTAGEWPVRPAIQFEYEGYEAVLHALRGRKAILQIGEPFDDTLTVDLDRLPQNIRAEALRRAGR